MDDKRLDEIIKSAEENLSTLDKNSEDFDKGVDNLVKLRGLRKPEKEEKKGLFKWFSPDALLQAFVALVGIGVSAGVASYQTRKVSDIEDEGVVTKSKTMSTMQKPKLPWIG